MAKTRVVRRFILITFIGLLTACLLLVAGLFFFSGNAVPPAPPPLELLPLSPAASSTAPDGTWIVGDGSAAGFRVPESFLVQSGTIVGRTSAVTGSLVIAHTEIASGSFQVDLRQITLGGKPNTSFFQLLETSKYPYATITFTQPLVFASLPANGQTISIRAACSLVMHGTTHTLTFMIGARYNGSVLEAAGSIPSLASDWGVKSPLGVHNDGVIEFLVVLHRG